MAMGTKSEICSDHEIFGQAHACCTFSLSPSPSPSLGPCPRPEESAFSTYPSEHGIHTFIIGLCLG